MSARKVKMLLGQNWPDLLGCFQQRGRVCITENMAVTSGVFLSSLSCQLLLTVKLLPCSLVPVLFHSHQICS